MTNSKSPTLQFTNSDNSLRNHFLLAMPSLKDSIFEQTVTFICNHDENGAMGLIINQPLNLTFGEVFAQLNISATESTAAEPVLYGGPVQTERGFILHTADSEWESTMVLSDDLRLTASRDILEAMAAEKGPKNAFLLLGYAGWGPGQLESELEENSWLTLPANKALIFDTPTELRWQVATKQLGVDLNLISPQAGHA